MPRPTTLPEPWRALVARFGSVEATAEKLLTTPRTLHRWAHGIQKPNPQAQALIDKLMRSLS